MPIEYDFYEAPAGKKAAKITGTIGENGYRELMLMMKPSSAKKDKQQYIPQRVGSFRNVPLSDRQKLLSMLIQDIPSYDERIPEKWRRLFDAARLHDVMAYDNPVRTECLEVIERNGGPAVLLQRTRAELEALFGDILEGRGPATSKSAATTPIKATASIVSIVKTAATTGGKTSKSGLEERFTVEMGPNRGSNTSVGSGNSYSSGSGIDQMAARKRLDLTGEDHGGSASPCLIMLPMILT